MVVIETVIVRLFSQRSKATESFFFKHNAAQPSFSNANSSSSSSVAVEVNDFYYSTESIIHVDLYALMIYPIGFHIIELAIPISALWKRRQWLKKLVSSADGHVDKGLSCNTWKEEWKYMMNEGKEMTIKRSISGRRKNGSAISVAGSGGGNGGGGGGEKKTRVKLATSANDLQLLEFDVEAGEVESKNKPSLFGGRSTNV